jgi:hypothetical protein
LLCPLRLYSRFEESNHGHRPVLRVRYGRPCHDGAAEKCDEIAPPHRLLRGSRLGVVPAQSSTSKAGRTRVRGAARHVRFGSKADIVGCQRDVRFTPKSGHQSGCLKTPSLSRPYTALIRNGIKVEWDCGFAFQF